MGIPSEGGHLLITRSVKLTLCQPHQLYFTYNQNVLSSNQTWYLNVIIHEDVVHKLIYYHFKYVTTSIL